MLDILHSTFVARALYVVTDLGVPDLLADKPRSCADLAAHLEVKPVPLHQMMRTLASIGLFRTEQGPETGPAQRYSLTEMGSTLQENHPTGTRDLVLTMQGPAFWDALRVLPERVATGKTGPEIAHDLPFFDYLARNPDTAKQFNRMMIASHGSEPAAVAAAYDFAWAQHIVDIGGGIGTLLLAVLDEHPHLTGIVFDLPDVTEHTRANITNHHMTHRCHATAGNFTEAIPARADAYLLSRILHDWDDHTCRQILRTCAAAMTPHSRLLIVEKVLPDNDEPHLGKMLDLIMATITHGRERTAGEYRELLTQCGLHMRHLTPTQSASSVIEAVLKP